ncbi:MAG: hypothetical protein AAGA68_06870 [Pseudomonadota bacterium]
MKRFLGTAVAAWLAASIPALEAAAFSGDVDIDVISPEGYVHTLYHAEEPRYASTSRRGDGALRAWLEAKPGEPYALRVRNRTGRRVGVVLAVDGRNIISAKRSNLSRSEAMYVLEPYQSAVYEGWRTGRNRVNEFYFTREQHSYAAAFEDYSAMGLISAAVYRDAAPRYRDPDYYADSKRAPGAGKQNAQPQGKAGTGFGDERYSPSRQVAFDAQRSPSSVMLVRYEWRETLCEMGIMRCARYGDSDRNRLWDRRYDTAPGGFAPYPPSRRYDHQRSRWWR